MLAQRHHRYELEWLPATIKVVVYYTLTANLMFVTRQPQTFSSTPKGEKVIHTQF